MSHFGLLILEDLRVPEGNGDPPKSCGATLVYFDGPVVEKDETVCSILVLYLWISNLFGVFEQNYLHAKNPESGPYRIFSSQEHAAAIDSDMKQYFHRICSWKTLWGTGLHQMC